MSVGPPRSWSCPCVFCGCARSVVHIITDGALGCTDIAHVQCIFTGWPPRCSNDGPPALPCVGFLRVIQSMGCLWCDLCHAFTLTGTTHVPSRKYDQTAINLWRRQELIRSPSMFERLFQSTGSIFNSFSVTTAKNKKLFRSCPRADQIVYTTVEQQHRALREHNTDDLLRGPQICVTAQDQHRGIIQGCRLLQTLRTKTPWCSRCIAGQYNNPTRLAERA